MKASIARLLTKNFKEPKGLQTILSHIKAHAKLGYSNYSAVISPEGAFRIKMQLKKLCYDASLHPWNGDSKNVLLEVEW